MSLFQFMLALDMAADVAVIILGLGFLWSLRS